MRHDLGQVQAELAAATQRATRLRQRTAKASRQARPRSNWPRPQRRASGWPPSWRARWSACRPRSMPPRTSSALQRLAQAIRQRDDAGGAARGGERGAPRARAAGARGGAWMAGRSTDQPVAAHRRAAGHRDCGRGPHPGPPRDRGSQAPAGEREDAERRIARELEVLGLRPPTPSPAAGVRARADVPLAARLRIAPRRDRAAVLARGCRRGHGARRSGAADRRLAGTSARPAASWIRPASAPRSAPRTGRPWIAARRRSGVSSSCGQSCEAERAMPEADLVARSAVRHAEAARAEAHLRQLHEQAPRNARRGRAAHCGAQADVG